MPEYGSRNYMWEDNLDSQSKNPPLLSMWQKGDSPLSRTLPFPGRLYEPRPKPETTTPTTTLPSHSTYDYNWATSNTNPTNSNSNSTHSSQVRTPTTIAMPAPTYGTRSSNSTSPTDHRWHCPASTPPCSEPSMSSTCSTLSTSSSYPELPYDLRSSAHIQDRSILRPTSEHITNITRHAMPRFFAPKSAKSEKERGRREKHNRAIERLRKLLPTALATGTKTDIVESGSEHIKGYDRDIAVARSFLQSILADCAENAPPGSLPRAPSPDEMHALQSLVGRPKRHL